MSDRVLRPHKAVVYKEEESEEEISTHKSNMAPAKSNKGSWRSTGASPHPRTPQRKEDEDGQQVTRQDFMDLKAHIDNKLSEMEHSVIHELREELRELRSSTKTLEDKIRCLESENSALKSNLKKLDYLSSHSQDIQDIIDNENERRSCHVVLSGRLVEEARNEENLVQATAALIKENINPDFHTSNILSAKRLGRSPQEGMTDKRKILVRLNNRETRTSLQRKRKQRKTEGLYMNDFLMASSTKVFYQLRVAKKKFPDKIGSVWTYGGKVYTKTSQSENRILIENEAQLRNFIDRVGIPWDSLQRLVGPNNNNE